MLNHTMARNMRPPMHLVMVNEAYVRGAHTLEHSQEPYKL